MESRDDSDMNEISEMKPDDVSGKKDLSSLSYFFGGSPGQDLKMAEVRESLDPDDILIGQTCISLPLGFDNEFDTSHDMSMASDFVDELESDLKDGLIHNHTSKNLGNEFNSLLIHKEELSNQSISHFIRFDSFM